MAAESKPASKPSWQDAVNEAMELDDHDVFQLDEEEYKGMHLIASPNHSVLNKAAEEGIDQLVNQNDKIVNIRELIGKFQWDRRPKFFGPGITFPRGHVASHRPENLQCNASICAAAHCWIDPKAGFKRFKWEVTWRKPKGQLKNAPNHDNMEFRIGFTMEPMQYFEALLGQYWNHPKFGPLQVAVQVSAAGDLGRDTVDVFAEGKHHKWVKSPNPGAKMNHSYDDRYGLFFDYEERQVSLLYNDLYICVVHDNFEHKVLPAMSFTTNRNAEAMVQCTKFKPCD